MDKNCQNLIESALSAKDHSAIDYAFASFLGSPTYQSLEAISENKSEKKKKISELREEMAKLYEEAGSWWQSLNKPFGYPGDFSLLELLYDYSPNNRSLTSNAQLLDLYLPRTLLGKAVRARKNILRGILEEFISTSKISSALSIASGSAREIRELPAPYLEKCSFHLLDADERPLSFAKGHFDSLTTDSKISYTCANALKAKAYEDLPLFDLVYSFGLFDYLPNKRVFSCCKHALEKISEAGWFIFCLKDSRYYDALFYELFYDWKFVHRTRSDGYAIAGKLGLTVEKEWITQGHTIIVYLCKKKLS